MKTVLLRSPVLTQSGYGQHARQIARYLLSKQNINVKFSVLPWGDTPWCIDSTSHGGLIDKIMRNSVGPDFKADVAIQLQLPNEFNVFLANVNVGVTASVETDRCNPEWIPACNLLTRLIMPSNHAKASLTNSGELTVPTVVIPEAYSDAVAKENLYQPFEFSTPFNFLVFGQITGQDADTDRKNLFYTIKWLTELFKDDPNVGIIVKTNVGRNSRIDRSLTTNLLTSVINEVRSGNGPKVHLLHGDMTDDEVAALYRHPSVRALVALTRGEGFGLPTLEAAASGLPVITTGWSGHLDFLKAGKFVSVAYTLNEVNKKRIDGSIFVAGARWADVVEEDAKRRIMKFRTSPDVPMEWARDLQKKLLVSHSQEAINSIYEKEIGDLL